MLSRANIRFPEDVAQSRKLIFDSDDKRFRAVLVKPADVPTYVEYGAADVIMESRADLLQPLDLGFGYCKLVVAGSKETRAEARAYEQAGTSEPNVVAGFGPRSDSPTIRVATKYPRITLDYYNRRGIPVEIIALAGSIELAPLIGLADRIVDLVETGRTLKENGLEIVEVIAESSARLLVNRAGYQTKREEVLALLQTLEKVVQCESSI